MNVLEELQKSEIKIPSPPVVAIRILEAVKDEKTSFKSLGDIISADPALTLKVLSIANSPFYGLASKIDNLERAIGILGINAVKNLALSFVIVKSINSFNNEEGFNLNLFWKRAVTAAVSAELLSKILGCRSDNTFVTALLMDIGIPIMSMVRPLEYKKVLGEKRINHLSTVEAERKVFKFDHQQVGAELLKKWGLPEGIYKPIRTHHSINNAQEYQILSLILNISDIISSIYHGSKNIEKLNILKKLFKDKLSISEKRMEEFIDTVGDNTLKVLKSFDITPGNMKPYFVILQEANEELQRLNISYEHLVIELRRAKKKAEELAKELMEANKKLQELALKDGLTGLFNHRYFQEVLDKEIQRAQRYYHPLSLAMIDIDYFKKINDTYGHPQGDIVLKKISSIIKENIT